MYFCSALVNCVNPTAVYVLHSMIAISFIAITSGLCAFILDLAGPRKTALRHIRRFAILNIFTGNVRPLYFEHKVIYTVSYTYAVFVCVCLRCSFTVRHHNGLCILERAGDRVRAGCDEGAPRQQGASSV